MNRIVPGFFSQLRNSLIVWILFVSVACANPNQTKRLKLIKAYEVQTNHSMEPSGLTEWNGEFFTVSDKHNYIYQLIFNQDTISLNPIIEIHNDKWLNLDLEGITHDETNFYLISEMHSQILKVSKDGSNQSWMPKNSQLKNKAQAVGLLQTFNAFFEGICLLNNHEFLLVAERQPRGFVIFNKDTNEIQAYQKDTGVFSYKNHRSPDFSGLSCDDGLYVLDRNAYVVAELVIKDGQFQQGIGYSYQHIIKNPKFQYQDMRYGHAEGLVVKGDRVFIILDNNRNSHQQDSDNYNSMFFELKK